MAPRRLVPLEVVEGWEDKLRAAVGLAVERQLASIDRTLRSHGLAPLTAASRRTQAAAATGAVVVANAWSQGDWARLVDEEVAPVADDVASEAVSTAGAAVGVGSLWGAATSEGAISSAIVSRALSVGASIGARVDAAGLDEDASAAVGEAVASASDILGSVLSAMANMAATLASDDVANSVTSLDAPSYLSASKTWNNQGDDKVREAHQDVDDAAINDYFDVGGESLIGPGDPQGSDENTINCRCVAPGTPVSALVLAAARRPFEGELVRLTTTAGHQFSATSDHRVLTDRGWIELGTLRPGDHLWRDAGHEPMRLRDPDEKHVVTKVEEVFDALVVAAQRTERIRLLTMDLNGAAAYEEIDVVGTSDGLPLYVDALGAEPAADLLLASAHREVSLPSRPPALVGIGHPQEVGFRYTPDLDPSTDESQPDSGTGDPELLRYELFGSALGIKPGNRLVVEAQFAGGAVPRELQSLRVADRPDGDAGAPQVFVDSVRVATQAPSDARCRLSALVRPDEIKSLERIEHHGFVYDLTCLGEWFMADGIVVHNCWVTYDGVVPEDSDYAGGNAPQFQGEGY